MSPRDAPPAERREERSERARTALRNRDARCTRRCAPNVERTLKFPSSPAETGLFIAAIATPKSGSSKADRPEHSRFTGRQGEAAY
jgi:hypothetical protein